MVCIDDNTASALLADQAAAARYAGGSFACLYLAPYNYHRIHMPLAGRLVATRYVPGHLYSVNAATARAIPGLFARNERVVCEFETALGPLAMVLVGALFVGSIETVYAGEINPPATRRPRSHIEPGSARVRQGRGARPIQHGIHRHPDARQCQRFAGPRPPRRYMGQLLQTSDEGRGTDWRPTATLETCDCKRTVAARAHFAATGVLEVETPVWCSPPSDAPQSLEVRADGSRRVPAHLA
jgi:hypothetical protein